MDPELVVAAQGGDREAFAILARTHGDRLIASLGSANLTRRNIGDYNLEANVALEMNAKSTLASSVCRNSESALP